MGAVLFSGFLGVAGVADAAGASKKRTRLGLGWSVTEGDSSSVGSWLLSGLVSSLSAPGNDLIWSMWRLSRLPW